MGITALGREAGAAGQNLYPAQLVRDKAHPPGPQSRRYDRWRDEHSAHIPVGAWVRQSGVDARMGARHSRRGQHGQVISRATTRLGSSHASRARTSR
jgi:hypothetical protein